MWSDLPEILRSLPPRTRIDGVAPADVSRATPVLRTDGSSISIEPLLDLFEYFMARHQARLPRNDAWLAPRVHEALRLSRAEAADRGSWQWLAAGPLETYVRERWGSQGSVAHERWSGGINKQAIARLWWGSEIFRRGTDYAPAREAFSLQDIPHNSLHRTFVRCRPVAQAYARLMAVEAPRAAQGGSVSVKAYQRVLNLALASSPPESETAAKRDDVPAYRAWMKATVDDDHDWGTEPVGPDDAGAFDVARTDALVARVLDWSKEREPNVWTKES